MAIIFTILFLAAVGGILKPYVRGMTRGRFAIAAVVLFVLIGISAPKSKKDVSSPIAANADTQTNKTNQTISPQKPPVESKWVYGTNKDEMRGSTSRYASLKSENEVDLNFPYGQTAGNIVIRKSLARLDVYFSVDSGQVLCDEFAHRSISVKFDDGPVQRIRCAGSSDGSSDTAFFANESKVLADLRKAKRTIVEAEFFQKGDQQFVFDTAGLDWK